MKATERTLKAFIRRGMRMRYRLVTGGAVVLASAIVVLAQRQPANVTPVALADACPDLSGTYATSGEDGGASFTIKQTRCERVDVVWEIHNIHGDARDSHQLTLDGQFRPDSGWFGGSERLRTAARFRGPTLEITRQSAEQPPTWTMGMFLQKLPSQDMCVGDFDKVNQLIPDEGDLWGNVKNRRTPHGEECRFSNAQSRE
jgi:hypothetical protein